MTERIAAAILAAGDSARMGRPKALLPFGSGSFLTHIIGTLRAAGLDEITVTVGRHAEEIVKNTSDRSVRYLVNTQPELGQISSVQLALRELDPGCAGCLIWPVDQPAVPTTLVEALLRTFRESEASIVMPAFEGKPGHPVIFRRDLIRDLLGWPAGQSPKELISRYRDRTSLVATRERGVVTDVDTPEDYQNLTGRALNPIFHRGS
jgi:CTP:molybdopterin cytidylyltransferase MocA